MTRYKASALHLLGSASVLFLSFSVIYWVWYPGRLFSAVGGVELLRLLVCVDLVLGPLIMLIIFDAKKKLIKLDVAIVLVCQLGFLGYGVHTIFVARPVYLAFVNDRFYMVRANEIASADQVKATDPTFKSMPYFGPVIVGTQEPSDAKTRNEIVFGSLSGMGIQNLPQYFVSYAKILPQVQAALKTSAELKLIEPEIRPKLQAIEKSHAANPVGFLMMVRRPAPLIAVIQKNTGEILELL